MAELSPKEREIEDLKAKLAGLEDELAGLKSSGTTEDVLVGLRNQIAAKETCKDLLRNINARAQWATRL